MAFDLHTLKVHVLQNVWLNTGLFAEEAIIEKHESHEQIPVTVHVDVSIGFKSGMQSARDETGREDTTERIAVLIAYDTEADSGGVEMLSIGDRFIRDASIDPDTTPYVYIGEYEYRAHEWTRYIFERVVRRVEAVR